MRSVSTEEYGYYALGRRVFLRARQDSSLLCSATCYSAVERYVWDGDQLVAEIRIPGGDGFTEASLNLLTPPYSSTHYGRVVYTHGPGIDRPLSIYRMHNSGLGGSSPTIVPHANWRGLFDTGTWLNGNEVKHCGLGVTPCLDIRWPGKNDRAYHNDETPALPDWMGSLIVGQRDGSGLMYRRNRYYDPATGRFTQEDPIGIAGGLNLYGYAGGDPVNLSDPFGLCPLAVDGIPCSTVYGLAGATGGAAWGASVGATGGTLVVPGVGTLAGAGSLGLAGAVIGGAGGALVGTAVDVGYAVQASGFGRRLRKLVAGGLTVLGGILGADDPPTPPAPTPTTPGEVRPEPAPHPPYVDVDTTGVGGR